jgi:ATP:corrinoid adenosyltransferase
MSHQQLSKGYVQVYTGDGKGKTTAALGLALRASGHGMRTYIGQFMKGQIYGELDALRDQWPRHNEGWSGRGRPCFRASTTSSCWTRST